MIGLRPPSLNSTGSRGRMTTAPGVAGLTGSRLPIMNQIAIMPMSTTTPRAGSRPPNGAGRGRRRVPARLERRPNATGVADNGGAAVVQMKPHRTFRQGPSPGCITAAVFPTNAATGPRPMPPAARPCCRPARPTARRPPSACPPRRRTATRRATGRAGHGRAATAAVATAPVVTSAPA